MKILLRVILKINISISKIQKLYNYTELSIIHQRSKKFEIVIIMDLDIDDIMHLVSCVITY